VSIRDWLEPMLREWGAQRRRIITGRLVRRDGTVHEDGWPSASVAAAMFDGGITGGSGHARQHFPEVYTGHAVEIWRAFSRASIEVRQVIHWHYVVTHDEHGRVMDIEAKAAQLGMSKARYFNSLNAAYYYFDGALDRLDDKGPRKSV